MADQDVDNGRRRFLTGTTAVVGAIGAGFAVWPFISSLQPSARAKLAGAPVEADISKLELGQRMIVMWRGQPVWLIRRTPEALAALATLDGRLKDPGSSNEDQQPAYAKNATRSINQEVLVLVGICTHLGCSPLFEGKLEPKPFDNEWKGGFFCPCHGSKFDLAGRVFQNVPAGDNLRVPPHTYLDDNRIMIGVNPGEGV